MDYSKIRQQSIAPSSIPYANRLIKEWEKHGKIIIACDFDDTIRDWGLGISCARAITAIKHAQAIGIHLVIWTASDPIARKSIIVNHCLEHGLRVDGINENPPGLPYGLHGKIYANIFIDDRGGLNEALTILEYAIEHMLSKNKHNETF